MALTVTITDNTLTILDNGVAATFNGSELLHPSYIAEVEQLTDGVALTPAPSAEGVPSDYAGNVVNYVVVLRFSDSKHQPLEIRLADVTNQPGWTNDQAGAIQAVTDIAVIMVLSGGGGGSGTVTSIQVSGGTTGYSFTGGPVTTSGTITMTGSAAIPTGNTLWVDRVYGDNGTALPNRQDLPYETVMGALAAASSGDLVHVRAGTSAEVITDASAPAVLHLYFEPGATAESISVSASGGWTITGGTLDEDITFSLGTGEILVLQTVTMRNLSSGDFNSITARECYLTGSATATNGGSINFRNCIIDENTTADGGNIISYSTAHRSDATVLNSGVLLGYDSSIGGTVTDDPVTGDFWDGVVGADGDIAAINADGTWSWSSSMPKRYKWLGDGGAATGTVIANTLGVTVNVTNNAAGSYVFTAASGSPFTTGKTTITVQPLGENGPYMTDAILGASACEAYFHLSDNSLADPPQYQVIIEVEL